MKRFFERFAAFKLQKVLDRMLVSLNFCKIDVYLPYEIQSLHCYSETIISLLFSDRNLIISYFRASKKLGRLAFSWFLALRRNLGNIKEKPTRKTFFSGKKKRLAPRIYHAKFCLVKIIWILWSQNSLKSTEFILYFHEKLILRRGRVFEKFQLQNLYKGHYKAFI